MALTHQRSILNLFLPAHMGRTVDVLAPPDTMVNDKPHRVRVGTDIPVDKTSWGIACLYICWFTVTAPVFSSVCWQMGHW
jgi:hypothetical protein